VCINQLKGIGMQDKYKHSAYEKARKNILVIEYEAYGNNDN